MHHIMKDYTTYPRYHAFRGRVLFGGTNGNCSALPLTVCIPHLNMFHQANHASRYKQSGMHSSAGCTNDAYDPDTFRPSCAALIAAT